MNPQPPQHVNVYSHQNVIRQSNQPRQKICRTFIYDIDFNNKEILKIMYYLRRCWK